LGIEYPGIMGIALDLYDPSKTISGLPSAAMIESVVAHEMGHQWFYNVVGNDQVDEPWLDESVVQYVTALYMLDAYGEQGYQGYRASWESRWERVQKADIPVGLPAGEYKGREYSAIVYGRGALFLEAMANKMGQARFDAFLRDYYTAHKWGIGTGPVFRQMAEKSCVCDLSELFKQWVERK
jgi:aminopeptidase N